VPPIAVTAAQVAAFRLARHHLTDGSGPERRAGTSSLVSVSSDVCGIQAQVMSAAELALWNRCRTTTRAAIQTTLWQERTLVKTSLMRMTLHLVPATEYMLYITALRRSRMGVVRRLMTRLKITDAEVAAMTATILDALEAGPMAQQELVALARRGASKRVQLWLNYAWSAFRPAIVEGQICYGPPKGSQVTLVRIDRWLPREPSVDEADARRSLAQRFLAAYGPANVRDFCKWSGIAMAEARVVWTRIEPDLRAVTVDGETSWILQRDESALTASELETADVRLLPAFDPLLLAHAEKDHLVERRHYKRVYRNQGWLSPVVLVGGRIAGVWSLRATARTLVADVDLFARASRAVRGRIEEEAAAMGRFLGTACAVSMSIGS
jgi:hypothetical protein